MKRKGIPKKRIGPDRVSRERSIRKRHIEVVEQTLNAAERSVYGYMSASLCGINEEIKENNYSKEVKRGASSGINLTGRSRERLALSCASFGVITCTTEACSINARRFKGKEKDKDRGKDRSKRKLN